MKTQKILRRMVAFFALLLAASSVAHSQADEKPGAKPTIPPTHADVSYGPHERNKLDVWCAKSDKPTPLVIFIHGGGWHGGDKGMVTDAFIKAMLDKGISVASISYRLVPEFILPAPVADAARAVQFLRSKAAEWNLGGWLHDALARLPRRSRQPEKHRSHRARVHASPGGSR